MARPLFVKICFYSPDKVGAFLMSTKQVHRNTHRHTHTHTHLFWWRKDVGLDPELHSSQMNSRCSGAKGMNRQHLFLPLHFQHGAILHSARSQKTNTASPNTQSPLRALHYANTGSYRDIKVVKAQVRQDIMADYKTMLVWQIKIDLPSSEAVKATESFE